MRIPHVVQAERETSKFSELSFISLVKEETNTHSRLMCTSGATYTTVGHSDDQYKTQGLDLGKQQYTDAQMPRDDGIVARR